MSGTSPARAEALRQPPAAAGPQIAESLFVAVRESFEWPGKDENVLDPQLWS